MKNLGTPQSGAAARWRRTILSAGAAVLLVAMAAAPVSAAPRGEWHRNNYNTGHERLRCLELASSWTCSYDNVPTPGFGWGDAVGHFAGRDVTSSWTCPAWFEAAICNNVVAVYSGVATYHASNNPPLAVPEEYVLTRVDGQQILYQYWPTSTVGRFYCPWFRTFDEALAAPFECTFAPI
jgi:hypothetical protein